MKKAKPILGVIGGLGPMATVYFLKMIIDLTDATKDQDHIDMVITNRASTYDRTEYITGKSTNNPKYSLIEDAKKLEKMGADFLVIPCNTAHYFLDEIEKNTDAKFINMIEETTEYIKNKNYKKVGILATDGTIEANIYQKYFENKDINYKVLDKEQQQDIMDIIYKNIKSGKKADMNKFNKIIDKLKNEGCDCVILGCTELSILKNQNELDSDFYIDSLEVLARKVISTCK